MLHVPTFGFVDRTDVRLVLEDYYDQARKAESANSYLGAVVGCGAVAEGVLTWALKRRDLEARAALTEMFERDKRLNKPDPDKPIEDWTLVTLIEVAKKLGVLDHDAEQACEAIRSYRNLVHPYKRVNGSPRFDASLEKSAFRAIERIVQALGGTASPAMFSDEEMHFGWVIEDRLAGCRGPKTRDDLKYLKGKGIRALVRLERKTKVTSKQIREIGLVDYLEHVKDFGTPTKQQLDNILNFIDEKYQRKIPVAVSCGAGYGRTGTILACFRARQDRSAQDPLTWLDEVRPQSAREIRGHPNQHNFISAFHRKPSAK
jgi:atypical dual specificity phosphatase